VMRAVTYDERLAAWLAKWGEAGVWLMTPLPVRR
jgi:hypothetical protein